jgi:hypothetical protein
MSTCNLQVYILCALCLLTFDWVLGNLGNGKLGNGKLGTRNRGDGKLAGWCGKLGQRGRKFRQREVLLLFCQQLRKKSRAWVYAHHCNGFVVEYIWRNQKPDLSAHITGWLRLCNHPAWFFCNLRWTTLLEWVVRHSKSRKAINCTRFDNAVTSIFPMFASASLQ